MRDRVKKQAISKGIASSEVWSGEELEERLRRDAPMLLKRFVEGESFPESPDGLRAFGAAGDKIEDGEILSQMAECFDREREVMPCGCGKDDCPVIMIKQDAAREMDRLRGDILSGFARVCPSFHPRLPLLSERRRGG